MRAPILCLSLIAVAFGSPPALADSPLEECARADADRSQMRRCLDTRMKAAESALADAYRAMRDEMERLDQAQGQPVLAKRFEGVQQSFRDYRDRHCAWVGVKAGPGSGAGDLVRDCRTRLAEERTKELQAQMPAPRAEPAAGQTAAGAVGAWRLQTMEADDQTQALVEGAAVTLRIAQDGRVDGVASINRYSGAGLFEPDGRLSWTGAMASTRMAGPEPLMEQEQRFLAALARVTHWQAEGDALVMSGEDGKVVLRFVR